LAGRTSRVVCFNGLRQTLTARENCETITSKNITIDSFGHITVLLGDHFSFPDNFEKLFNDDDSGLKSIFKISVIDKLFHKLDYTIEMMSYAAADIIKINRDKKIQEKSIKELVGSTVEEFKHVYFHKTTTA